MDLLADAAARRPSHPALDDGTRVWSYRELHREARRRADRLRGRGAGPGRIVAVVLPPTGDAVITVHAVLATGALLAPLAPTLTPRELAEALAALDPVLVVGDVPAGPGDGVSRGGHDGGGGVPAPLPSPRPLAVLWTSGTSGRPKGVVLGEGALRHSAEASAERLDLGAEDRWLASLSIAHVGGLALVTRAALLGATLVAPGPVSTESLDRLVDEGRVTHASLVPTVLRRLLDHRGDRPPPPTLACLLVGGASCPPALVERASAAGFPVALTYGCTEASSQVATAAPALVRTKPDTVGPPLRGVEVRLDRGEIVVRGPTLALGLLGGGPVTDPAGWLRTGDLGEMDSDGHLRVTGRLSDRIVTGGVNVDPGEVEAVLAACPEVLEAAVVGLPDAEWGERVVAAVALREGAAGPESVRRWARERLSGAKAPKEVLPVDSLPRNANGKVDRAAVASLLSGLRDA